MISNGVDLCLDQLVKVRSPEIDTLSMRLEDHHILFVQNGFCVSQCYQHRTPARKQYGRWHKRRIPLLVVAPAAVFHLSQICFIIVEAQGDEVTCVDLVAVKKLRDTES
mmetsp:Transcript_48036/g.75010  ORF Transcript_48036/g.75010 Transcript_48036/m.75010 type:complete len:109 (+) Transcript_48036:2330-2656(+)